MQLGGLRSVRAATHDGRDLLLAGARSGVIVLDPERDALTAYPFRNAHSLRGGVNAAVLGGDRLYATHSEVGLSEWQLDYPDSHRLRLEDELGGCQSVRDLQAGDGRLWLAADRRAIGWRCGDDGAETTLDAGEIITALLAAEGDVYAGLKNGAVLRWMEGNPESRDLFRPTGGEAVGSLSCHPGGGVPRLVVADTSPHLALYVIGDQHRSEYRCDERVRRGWAADDLLCGVNDRRDMILLWNPAEPQQPTARIPVARLCGHSIQDVALL